MANTPRKKPMSPKTAASTIKRRLLGRSVKRAYSYWTGGGGSSKMNQMLGTRPLRPKNTGPYNNAETPKIRAHFEAMKRHAKKFPRTVPVLYRGMARSDPKSVAMLTNFTTRRNKSHHVPTFWSFSSKKHIASIWSQGPSRRGNTQYGYVLTLNRGRYPSIKHNSYTPSNMSYESEVTLAPGTYTMVGRTNNIIHVRYTPNK